MTALMLLASLVLPNPLIFSPVHAIGRAATLYVAPGASCGGVSPCYSAIQTAIDAAQAGDTIKVAAGTYTGPGVQVVYITKSLALAGGFATANWNQADPQANLTTIDAQNQVGRRGIVAETPGKAFNVSISGFTVINGNNAPPQGCGGICAVDVIADIRNNTVLSNTGGGIYVVGGADLGEDVNVSTIALNTVRYSQIDVFNAGGLGIAAENTNAVVSQNLVEHNYGIGIWTFRGSNVRILNNTVQNNDSSGILSATARRLIVDGNAILSNSRYGISLGIDARFPTTDTLVSITNNTVQGNSWDGLSALQTTLITGTISSNTFSTSRFSGANISLNTGSLLTFTQNTVTGNKFGGVVLDVSKNSTGTVLSNVIASNGGSGVVVTGQQAGNALIKDNSVQDNQVTNSFNTDGGGGIRVEGGTVRIERNRIIHNKVNGYGGGIFVNGKSGPFSFTYVSLDANQVLTNTSNGLGAGIAVGGGIVTATNDIIARNFAELPAVYVFSGTLNANYWTIANNGSYGMRVFNGGLVTLRNSVVAGHKVAGLEQSSGGDLQADRILSWDNGVPCAGQATCTNVIVGDPKFLSDRAINYHITAGSAAIDKAVDFTVHDDIDGPGRPQGSAPDLGADEFGNYTPTVNEVFMPIVQR